MKTRRNIYGEEANKLNSDLCCSSCSSSNSRELGRKPKRRRFTISKKTDQNSRKERQERFMANQAFEEGLLSLLEDICHGKQTIFGKPDSKKFWFAFTTELECRLVKRLTLEEVVEHERYLQRLYSKIKDATKVRPEERDFFNGMSPEFKRRLCEIYNCSSPSIPTCLSGESSRSSKSRRISKRQCATGRRNDFVEEASSSDNLKFRLRTAVHELVKFYSLNLKHAAMIIDTLFSAAESGEVFLYEQCPMTRLAFLQKMFPMYNLTE